MIYNYIKILNDKLAQVECIAKQHHNHKMNIKLIYSIFRQNLGKRNYIFLITLKKKQTEKRKLPRFQLQTSTKANLSGPKLKKQ